MDRAHLAPHKVHVFTSHADRLAGHEPIRAVQAVPYPSAGYDYYRVDGVMYPGYCYRAPDNEACIYLDRPMR